MSRYLSFSTLLCLMTASVVSGQQAADRVDLGQLANGAALAFVRAGSGEWGIEISGGTALRMAQAKPAQVEIFAGGENARQLAAGYRSIKKQGGAVVATAKAACAFEDQWKVSRAVLSLSRKVEFDKNLYQRLAKGK